MKHIITLAFLIFTGVFAHAQSMSGDITAVDATAATVTVSSAGGTPRTYRTRPSVEVLVNGTKGKLADLAEGMTIKVTSAEPGFATRIEAAGTTAGGTSGAATDSLEKRLIGQTWLWYESDKSVETMHFQPGGIAHWSIQHRGPFKWQVTPDGKRIEGTAPPNGKKFKMTFDATLTKGKIYEGDKRPRDTKLITK